jgi:hypothetical protein
MKTAEITIYTFAELSDKAKEKALEYLSDINTYYEWWDYIYEDAENIGLRITSFDTYQGEITGELCLSISEIATNIIESHGKDCGTYKVAQALYATRHGKENRYKDGSGNDDTFKNSLLAEYLSMLSREYDYLTSEESIIETIEANEYDFTEDGKIF